MHPYHIQNISTITVLSFATIIGARKLPNMDTPSRIIYLLVAIALLTEITAYYAGLRYHNNLPVYNAFSIIEIVLVSFYFNYTIYLFRKYAIGLVIGSLALIAGMGYHFHYHRFNLTNSHYLMLNAIITIVFSMVFIVQLIVRFTHKPIKYNPHFWFSCVFLFFSSTTLLTWAAYDYLTAAIPHDKWIVDWMIFLVSLLTHLSYVILFLLYDTMRNKYATA